MENVSEYSRESKRNGVELEGKAERVSLKELLGEVLFITEELR